MKITAEIFEAAVGVPPDQDDLERCNCEKAGQVCHLQCGWDDKRDMPNFIPGKSRRNVVPQDTPFFSMIKDE